MNTISYDSFENKSFEPEKLDLVEKLKSFNKHFESSVKPEGGFYGAGTINKADGIRIEIYRNEEGLLRRDYLQDGKLFMRKIKISDGLWEKTYFDDNGTPYIKGNIRFGKNIPREFKYELSKNTQIQKGNFQAFTDSYGRPILNEVKNLQLRDGNRKSLNLLKTSDYRAIDERGHIIADSLGGTATAENIVAQDKNVNRSMFKEVENLVRKLKVENPDSKIDYSVKTNYADKTTRPSSFEPKIVIDGKTFQLPDNLKKIYNEVDMSKLEQAKMVANEGLDKIRQTHESGMDMGKNAVMITLATSTVDNLQQFASGEISAEEMVVDIAKETGVSGAVGYGTGFISSAVSRQMMNSGHELIRSVGGSAVPAAIVSFGVESFDSINSFAKGDIDLKELCYDLGENGVGIAGSMEGAKYGAMAGAAIGGPAGAAVGGFVGGMVGYAVTTEAYATVVELGGEGASKLTEKAQELASGTYEAAKEIIPEKAESVKASISDFASKAGLPLSL